MNAAADPGRVLPFRRRRFARPRRRRFPFAGLARAFATALMVVATPVAAVAWVTTSPRFNLAQLRLTGTARVPVDWLERALAPLRGSNLVSLSLARVRRLVAAHPWVAATEIRKRLPDRLEVTVRERRPAALLRRGPDLVFMDAGGEVIAPFVPAPGEAEDLLLLAAPGPAEARAALELAARLGRSEPSWAGALSEIEALPEGDFRVHVEGVPYPLLVAASRLDPALAAYRRWAGAIGERFGPLAAMDLRFPQRILIEPAASPDVAAPDRGR